MVSVRVAGVGATLLDAQGERELVQLSLGGLSCDLQLQNNTNRTIAELQVVVRSLQLDDQREECRFPVVLHSEVCLTAVCGPFSYSH